MNVGIVGLGKMGLLHAGILNTIPDVKITSITERENFLTKYIKKAVPTANVYNNHEEMIDSEDLDALFITTPTPSHYQIIAMCIEKGINFFVEKPLTKNFDEAKLLCSKLKNSNILSSVGFNLRFLDTFSKAKSLLDANILGEISQIKSSMYVSHIFSKPSGWRFKSKESGGGVLLELGCHLIDLVLWYFGPIVHLTSTTKSLYSSVDDFAHIDMKFRNELKGEFETSWSVRGYRVMETNIEVKGKNGNLRVNQDFIDIKLKNPVPTLQKNEQKIFKQALGGNVSFDVGGPEYTKEDEHFVECLQNNKRPLVNAFEASKVQGVIQAAYDSAATKKVTEVEYIE